MLNLSADNFESPIGGVANKLQRLSDPLSWATGGKMADWATRDIPRASNEALSKVVQPFAAVDKTINPVRQMVPFVDDVSNLAEKKPASALGMAAGAIFGGGALAGAAGAGGAGGTAGAAGGSGAASLGGAVPSTALPGILPGATVGGSTTGAGGLFGGGMGGLGAGLGVGSGSVAAPAITGGASMFSGGSLLSSSAKDQIISQMARQFAGQQDQRANQYRSQVR